MKRIYYVLFAAVSIALASCTSSSITMREPNTHVEMYKTDFTFSDQFSADASSNRIFMIDFARLFKKSKGNVAGEGDGAKSKSGFKIENVYKVIAAYYIPVIGISNYINSNQINQTTQYALYNLMSDHKGYDVVFYPQYEVTVERPILGIGILYKKINVTATARLAKIKKGGSTATTEK